MGFRQIWDCPCCGQLHWGELPCRRLDCHHCQEDVSSRRGARKHELMGGMGLGAFVVTLPRSWGPSLCGEAVWMFRKRVAHLILEAYQDGRRVKVGCVAILHPEGDSGDLMHRLDGLDGSEAELPPQVPGPQPAPLTRWGPHVHVTVPLAGVRDGRVLALQGWSKGRLLESVKSKAQALLDEMADSLSLPPAAANVHYRYMKRTDPARVGHRLRYDLRSFPDWGASEDKGVRRAMRVQGFGLLAPNARCQGCRGSGSLESKNPCICGEMGLAGYRARIVYENEEGEGYNCRKCLRERGAKVPLQIMFVTREGSYIWQHLADICIPLDSGEGTSGSPQGPPAH